MLQLVKFIYGYLPALNNFPGLKCVCFLFFILYFSFSFAQNGTIHGTVKDGETVLESVTISMANKTALTNYAGEFSITTTPGFYTLLITHIGYKKIEQRIILQAGEKQSLQFNMIREEQMGEVVVLGSRFYIQRNNLNTTAPVDLITSNELKQTGQQSLIQMLNFAAPSLNTSRQNLWEPVTLRGLGPDHSLILLNNTRYHHSAYINSGSLRGMLGRGSVSNDINSIPFSAIEKIEILRDGSTAQYGSDAIGGVLNIVLKKTTQKTSVNLHLGQHYKGDGESIVLGINRGISLNKKSLPADRQGFLNFSGDFRSRESTHRGGIYNGTVYTNNKVQDDSIIKARGFNRKDAVSNDGIIPLHSFGFLVNGGYSLNSNVELWWTATATYRHGAWPGVYRYPKSANTVNTLLHPDGFKSVAVINTWDLSGIASARGKTNNGWIWEWNSVYGKNTNRQLAENSNNASQTAALGANAPTEFYGGRPIFIQQTNTLSFVKDIAKKIRSVKTFNIGFGAEYRFEKICSWQGEEASWKNYDTTGRTQGGAPGSGGIDPKDVVNENRSMVSLYADLETDINDRFLINVSGRFENYNDFGNNLAGKLAMRYKFSPAFTLRGSISNGYHAPALQQTYFNASGNTWRNVAGVNIQVQRGIFRNNSNVAKAFGVKSLQPEKAINLGAGIISTLSSHINITVDGYWIEIKKRIVLSGIFEKANNADVRKILINYPDIDQVQFLANAINTRNRGVDIVLNSNWKIKKAVLRFILAA
ncbi:MAG TPA: TonB-dependent receptor, partial [Chitinophagaceae bacterium]